MLKGILCSSFAALAAAAVLAPGAASAQTSCQEARHDNRVVGTVIGGVAGALLGNAIGEHGGKEGGTIIGGVGGAVAGNAIGAAATNCSSNKYGHYDDNGQWVPNTVTEYGYYDANGQWVDTSQGRAGPPPQSYGQQGYGQQGYAQDSSAYPPAPPPPDTDQPRYDRDNGYPPPPPPPGAYGDNRPSDRDGAYDRGDRGGWNGAAADTREQEDRLQNRIQQKIADGQLDDRAGRHALRDLDDIRRMDADYRDADGHLNPDQRQDILARLDALRARVRGDGERTE